MTRGRWSLWICGGCAIAAIVMSAVAMSRGWVVSDTPPALSLSFFLSVCAFGLGKTRFDETTVRPLPKNLVLVSRAEECGSHLCSVTYILATPDEVPISELSARLWRHLESKGWQRQRSNASCRDIGWLRPVRQCLFLRQKTPGVATLVLSTALDLPTEPS